MSTAAGPTPSPVGDPTPSARLELGSSWRLTDRIGLAMAWVVGLLFCAILAAIVIYIAVEGIHYLRPYMLWTNPTASSNQNSSGGLLPYIIGSVLVTAIALLIAVPVGVGVAVWLSEYARPRALARVVESTVEMFAGAPSIVLALFGLIVFEAPFLAFLSTTENGHVYGKGFIPAGTILSLLALPLIVTSVREGLQAIPNHVREASYAVGKTKIATIRRVLLPAARPSVISGAMVGAGHVIGDTAIITFLLGDTTTLEKVGNFPVLDWLRGTDGTLTSFVYNNAPTGDLDQPGKAFAAAFILIVIVLILNVLIDIYARRARELKWS